VATNAALPAETGRGIRAAIIALGVVVLGLLVLLIVELTRDSGSSSGDESLALDRQAATASATAKAKTLFSYDYRRLDADLAAARAVTTGSFTEDYDKVSVPSVKPLAAKYKVIVSASVLGASIVDDAKPTQIKVLLFLNQTVRNSQLSAPRVDSSRTVLTMQLVGKDWKVANVDAL
jgi:Mce-associated membrane protein